MSSDYWLLNGIHSFSNDCSWDNSRKVQTPNRPRGSSPSGWFSGVKFILTRLRSSFLPPRKEVVRRQPYTSKATSTSLVRYSQHFLNTNKSTGGLVMVTPHSEPGRGFESDQRTDRFFYLNHSKLVSVLVIADRTRHLKPSWVASKLHLLTARGACLRVISRAVWSQH